MQEVEKATNYHNIIKAEILNDTDNASEVNILPSVKISLKNITEKEGFILYKIITRAVSSNGNNFLGDLYEIDIKGETKDGPKEINIFLKHAIPGEAMKPVLDINTCYSHELFFYSKLSHIFDTLQDTANIPKEERLNVVQSYENNPDAIILENLASKGFKTLYRMDVMSIKFAELSIAQLAKLHGLSFVLKHTKKNYFENKIETLETQFHFDLQVWISFVKRQFENSTVYFDSDTQKKILKFMEYEFIPKFPKYLTGVTDSIKCMCHGDIKMNNVLFKETDEKNSEVVIIDYQFLHYGSAVIDILYFLYTGTDRNFRKAHMNNLKDLYHEELAKFLMYFDLDINNVYPKKVYEKDFKDSLEFGLMAALYISPIIFTIEDQVPDFGKDSINAMSFTMDPRHKKRITEIVEEYMEYGILN